MTSATARCAGSSGISVGGDQPLYEPPEPGVARVERAEMLEQALSRPVAGVADHVLLDLPPKAREVPREETELAVVHVPQGLQEGHEALGPARQDIEDAVEGPRDLAPDPLRYLGGSPASPEHVLEREAGSRARRQLDGAREDLLRNSRKASIR